MPKRFSTARGREFGDAIRAAVASTGMSAREICEKIDWDPGKLSDLMNGKGGCTEVDLAILLSFCRIVPEERDHLMSIHDDTGQKIWWQHFADQQSFRMRTFLEHLWKAKEFVVWQPLVLPGLLQLPDYLRAVCLETVNLPHEEIEDRVTGRLAMQQVFRQRLDCTFYVHEQVLLSRVGGADVMRFDRHEPVVFLEAENSILVVERKDSIRDCEDILKALERKALDEEASPASTDNFRPSPPLPRAPALVSRPAPGAARQVRTIGSTRLVRRASPTPVANDEGRALHRS
ncbi:Scr1 family TA system antitoxin-like transcriptional regulator [Lentzea sp. CA-135723]|uniref:Scr1 family TA system antitoxin-like transcriptional regulator n=1 Tax=Lentzea sp. CA-135723 TaxID=3239950 RepID=UPI003D8DE821